MDFIVNFLGGGSRPFTGASRKFLDSGVLEVTSEGRRYHYSPAYWGSVEEDVPKSSASGVSAVMPVAVPPDPDEPDWMTRQF